jgi:hypothetical protein
MKNRGVSTSKENLSKFHTSLAIKGRNITSSAVLGV